MARSSRILLVLALLGSTFFSQMVFTNLAVAQCTLAPGAVTQLSGTPHLFVADDAGVLHWVGDTRALEGQVVEWSNRCTLSLSEIMSTQRGDPWLSTGLVRIGPAIYLAKWEAGQPSPTLLRIQSAADIELFGVTEANAGTFIWDLTAWQQRYGFQVSNLSVGPLAAAEIFSWPDEDRANYEQVLVGLESLETTAFLQNRGNGTDPTTVLLGLVQCEQLGLSEFGATRSTSRALTTARDCFTTATQAAAPVVMNAPPTPILPPTPVLPPPPPSAPTPVVAPPTPNTTGSTGLATNAPTAPTGVRLTSLQGNGMRLDWNDVANNEEGYRVMRGSQLIATLSINTVSYVDTAYNAGTPSCYTVLAFNASGDAASLASCPGSPSAALPVAPSRLHITLLFDGSGIRLDWVDNSNNEDGFRILRRGVQVHQVDPNIKTWTDFAPDPGTYNCYRVVAFNVVGQTQTPEACPGDY